MSEFLASAFALAIGAILASALGRRLPVQERRWIWYSLVAHQVSAVVKVWLVYVYYNGVGDITSYVEYSQNIAQIIRMDPGTWLVPYLQWGLDMNVNVPYVAPGGGSSTQAMYMVATLHQLAFGATAVGVSLLVSAFSFASKVGLYFAMREHFPERFRKRIQFAILLLPSAVFWSSSLSKEGMLWTACGWIPYGVHLIVFKRKRLKGLLIVLAASFVAGLFKTYVLIPMALGCGVWVYASSRKSGANRHPLRSLAVGAVTFGLALLVVFGVGEIFPRYKISSFAEESSTLREQGDVEGSYYAIEVSGGGIAGQLAAAPAAALTAMYRPFLFEARNPLMLANALETTFFLLLTLHLLRVRGLGLVREVAASPTLQFCAVFVLVLSVAVGLSSTNLGTLSRYRMPMMPFFGVFMAVLTPIAVQQRRAPGALHRPRHRRKRVVPLHP